MPAWLINGLAFIGALWLLLTIFFAISDEIKGRQELRDHDGA